MAQDTPKNPGNEKTAPTLDNQTVDTSGKAPVPEVADNTPPARDSQTDLG